MMGALEMVADKRTKKVFEPKAGIGAKAVAIAQEEGVILRNLGDALALCPPLIISPEEIDDLFDRVARTLDRVLDHAKAEGLLAA
jgi:4-aminobutyrate--pyruvate transaminase